MKPKGKFSVELLDPGGDELTGKSCDAFVRFEDGSSYAVTVFTLDGIAQIMKDKERTTEFARGAYFWCSDLLILRTLDEEHLRAAVEDSLADGSFESIFTRCRDQGADNGTRG
jgi:hypothetical protein